MKITTILPLYCKIKTPGDAEGIGGAIRPRSPPRNAGRRTGGAPIQSVPLSGVRTRGRPRARACPPAPVGSAPFTAARPAGMRVGGRPRYVPGFLGGILVQIGCAAQSNRDAFTDTAPVWLGEMMRHCIVLAIKFRIKSTTYTRGCLARSCQERDPAAVHFRTCQRQPHWTVCMAELIRTVRVAGSVDAECRPHGVWAPAGASLLWPQPLKRLYYRYLPVVEHPYYRVPHLVQTPEESVGCGRPDLAPFCLWGLDAGCGTEGTPSVRRRLYSAGTPSWLSL